MKHFLQFSCLVILCLFTINRLEAQCPPFAGTDSLLCGFTTTLSADTIGGTWSVVCDESAGLVEFANANEAESDVTVSTCGTYTFVYALDTPDCTAQDTVKIGFEDPSTHVITGEASIGLEVDYQCPSSNSDCSASLTIGGVSPPTFNWSMDLIKECCPVIFETLTQNPTGDCEADIAVEMIVPTECSVSENNWSGGQSDLVNVDDVIVSSNFFDIYLPLLEGLADCGPIGEDCTFEDIPEACDGEIEVINDTLIVEIPYSTGMGQWHYVENVDSLIPLQDTTQLPPPFDFATLIIEPNSQYVGPNEITFSAWESDSEGNLFPLMQPLELFNRLQWVYLIEYVSDTLITQVPICESGDCFCGCSSPGFFPAIDIPSPDLGCSPISLSFYPPGSEEVFWDYPGNVFCEDETSVSPNVFTSGGCSNDYMFSGSDGLVIDPFSGEISISASGIGTFEIYLTTSNGYFDIMVIDILPIEFLEFEFPPSLEVCGNYGGLPPTILSGLPDGFWDISGGGVIDSATGVVDVDASGSGTFTVTFTPNAPCAFSTSQDIDIIVLQESAPTNINCSSSLDAVFFSWDAVPNADSYTLSYSINGAPPITTTTTSTNFEVSGLLPGDMVTLTVEAMGGNLCIESSTSSSTCITSDCPPLVLTIDNLNPYYCIDEPSFELTATPAGGVFTGNGIESDTNFSPAAAGIGSHTLQYEYTDFSGCSYSENFTVTVLENPNADFAISQSEVCQTDTVTVNYIGGASNSSIYEWDFGDAIVADMGGEIYELTWNTTGEKIITLQVTDQDGCSSPIEEITVEVIAPLEAVSISCYEVGIDMVSFNWTEAIGYDFEVTYTVNGENAMSQITSNNSLTIENLNPSDEVAISVTILNEGVCGNSEMANQTCITQDCPEIELVIEGLSSNYCVEDAAIDLSATPIGGTFSVNGTPSNVFDPAALGVGTYSVEYIWLDGDCSYNTNQVIEVFEPLEAVILNCNTTENSITFEWNDVMDNMGYQLVLSGDVTDTFTQETTTYTVENLEQGAEVTIEVITIGTIECANSPSAAITCNIPIPTACLTETEINEAVITPTAFSPNDDGVNDAFQAVFPFTPTDYDLQVFNRWGERVFWSQNVERGWEGLEQSSLQAANLGVYVWHLQATVENECGETLAVQKQGNVTLVR